MQIIESALKNPLLLQRPIPAGSRRVAKAFPSDALEPKSQAHSQRQSTKTNRRTAFARIFRMISRRLWPQAHSTALSLSPSLPKRKLRPSRPSLFRCPMVGSIAERRFHL
jgi:hypothetical protein